MSKNITLFFFFTKLVKLNNFHKLIIEIIVVCISFRLFYNFIIREISS